MLSLRDSALPGWLDWWDQKERGLLLASLIVITSQATVPALGCQWLTMAQLVLPTKCSAYSCHFPRSCPMGP